MLEWSIEAVAGADSVGQIVVALPPGEEGRLAARDDLHIVAGGPTRAESVANALAATEAEVVVIQDAARPLVTPALVDDVVGRLLADDSLAGAIAVAAVTDTIKRVENAGEEVAETIDRDSLRAAQTPQAFRADALRKAIEAADAPAATDEAMLVEAAGGCIALVEAPGPNPKVTGPDDLVAVGALLAAR